MDKQTALALANNEVTSAVALARQSGKASEEEIIKFEKMCQAVIAKGEALPQSFFDGLDSDATKRDIFRAIHAA